MASRPSRTSKISYVDSDSDSDSSDSGVEQQQQTSSRSSATTTSKDKGKGKMVVPDSPPVAKKPKQATSSKEEAIEVQKAPTLELLLTMPLDILSEVCSHLPPVDLIQLARTSKQLRSFLLSRNSRAVWISARAKAGFPTLKHIKFTPMQYLLMVAGSDKCHGCDERGCEPTLSLGLRLCKSCRGNTLLTRGPKVKRELPELHPLAVKCVPWPEIKSYRSAWKDGKPMARKDQLELASDALEELAVEDAKETDERAILELRAKGGGRTRRAAKEVTEGLDLSIPHTDRVGTYVAKKQAWAQGCIAEEEKIWKVIDDAKREQAQKLSDIRKKAMDAERKREQQTQDDLLAIGWTPKERDGWAEFGGVWRHRFTSKPTEDQKGWDAAKKLVNDRIALAEAQAMALAAKRALEGRQRTRKQAVENYFDDLRDQESGEDKVTFPRLNPFLLLPTVKRFWEEDEDKGGEKLTAQSWKASLKAIKKEIKAHRATVRNGVIRQILTATGDHQALATNDFPESKYGDAFFQRITSQFISGPASWGRFAASHGSVNATVVSYPSFLSRNVGFYGSSNTPTVNTSSIRIQALRAILKAAGLDEKTATVAQLDALGRRLRWNEYPVYKKSNEVWDWKALILEVERRKRRKNSLGITVVLEGTSHQANDSDDEMGDEDGSDEEEEEEQEQGSGLEVGGEAGPSSGRRGRRQSTDEVDVSEEGSTDGDGDVSMQGAGEAGGSAQAEESAEEEDELEGEE